MMNRVATTAWFLQRITGVLLFITLGGHFFVYHYFMGPGMWGFDSIGYGATDLETLRVMAEDPEQMRFYLLARFFAQPVWKVFDVTFISLASFHGFYGVSTSIDDLVSSPRWRNIGNWTVYALGAVIWFIGVRAVVIFNPELF